MCGITGIICFDSEAIKYKKQVENSVVTLKSRGPDANGVYFKNNVGFGHTRLSIIDTTDAGAQPFIDPTSRYSLVFNGEFYNHLDYKKELSEDGIILKSESDTEVLLYLLIKYGEKAIEKINGCFSFAFFDSADNTILIARDRLGINPLHFYQDKDKLVFASEMKGLFEYNIPKILDYETLSTYFQLNYVPTNQSMIKDVRKLTPGTFLKISGRDIEEFKYYEIPKLDSNIQLDNYNTAKENIFKLLNESVKRRMIADVPLGCFLSGGVDSSVITALASENTKNLNTFSIGFTDNEFFDETSHAEVIAKKYKTNHTSFKVSNDDLLNNLDFTLQYLDEPFADSSAMAVNILSQLTKKKVTVALSGDGADEMFSGYNKHSAHFNASFAGAKEKLAAAMNPLWKNLPKSRNSRAANFARQLNRFSTGYKLSPAERYWFWASIGSDTYTKNLIKQKTNKQIIEKRKEYFLDPQSNFNDLNTILYTDLHLVLQGDMLTKVDLMSMANSLEVRTPFLDHTLINYVAQLPVNYKIDKQSKKKILKETFKEYIPEELLTRAKHGFEVPILDWFKKELWSLIDDDLLSERFIGEQNIFNYSVIKSLKEKIHSANPEDSAAKVYALIVFQYWWKKYFTN